MKISAVILTKNEEKIIKRAIDSVMFCDEILIVDDYSTDKTEETIQNLPLRSSSFAGQAKIRILKRHLQGDFASQRNFAMEKAIGEWILFVDADEVVGKKLSQEISNAVKNRGNNVEAYFIKRRDFFWGKELRYGETRKVRHVGLIRLVKKGAKKWFGTVHEVFMTPGNTERLNGFLDHYPHPTLAEFLNKINMYSTLRAKELLRQEKHPHILEMIFFPFGKFIYNYFINLGFLDGPAGFAYAFMMSFHSFLVRAKLYQYTKIDKRR